MKEAIEQRSAKGLTDHIALALTTFGVGYIPGAPGTYGSAVGVAIYLVFEWVAAPPASHGIVTGFNLALLPAIIASLHSVINAILLTAFCLIGIWASGRSAPIFGRKDPSQAVVDEVMGQLITLAFIPFGAGWKFILAGFFLFRLFDIVKPYPVRQMEVLKGGLGICADDMVAGVYAGICLSAAYAIYLTV